MPYALTTTLDDHQKWVELLQLFLPEAEFVEFHVLYKSYAVNNEIAGLQADRIEAKERNNRFFPDQRIHRYRISDSIKNFILSKPYHSWLNYQYEDLTLIKDEEEILSTITHENYLFIKTNDTLRADLNRRGFNFGELFEP